MSRNHALRRAALDLAGVLCAAGAILIYGLSCRPAWDPAGKRVAFPYRDGDRSGVAIYETGKELAQRLVEEEGDGLAGAQCVWSGNGRWLYVLRTVDENTLRLLRVDPGTGQAETFVDIAGLDDANTMYPPALADDRWLWVSAGESEGEQEHGAFRIDLAERRVEHFFAHDELDILILDGAKKGLVYVRAADDGPTEVGRLDSKGPRLVPFFTSPPSKSSAPFPWIDPAGERIAWFGKGSGGFRLRVMDQKGRVQDEIPLPDGMDDVSFAAWTRGGLVAAADRQGSGSRARGLLGVDLGSRKARFVALGAPREDDEDIPMLEPAVSSDGGQLAVAVSGTRLSSGSTAALLVFDAGDLDARPIEVGLAPRAEKR